MASRLQSAGFGRIDVTPGGLRSGLPMLEVLPSGANLQRLATTLIEAFSDRRVELYDDPD